MIVVDYIHIALSFVASLLRFGAGASGKSADLEKPLVLYEFEGCPFCRIAREAISQTGTPVLVRPCPKGGKRFRPSVKEQGGKAQFPYLIDPNTGAAMYESADIAIYLRKTYDGGSRPFIQWLGPINQLSSQLGVLARLFAGTYRTKAKAPQKPLEFYGAERDPRARFVKERLCAMELEYLWLPLTRDKPAPYLFDPNSGEEHQGASAIRKYLKATYTL